MTRSKNASRRLFSLTMILAGTVVSLPSLAFGADQFPSRPIKLVVPFPPGQGADGSARILGNELSAVSGQPVIVENRPGGNNVIGAKAVTGATPDGYTLFYGSNSPMAANGVFFRELGYDPVKDFSPVAMLGRSSWVLVVSAESPHQTFADLVKFSKDNPSTVSVGVGATGYQLAAILMTKTAGMDAIIVPYKGSPQVIQDVVGQQVTATMTDFGTLRPLIASGRVRPLLVLDEQRLEGIPDVPSLKDVNLDIPVLFSWTAIFAPAGTPKEIRSKLADMVQQATNREAYMAYAEKAGTQISFNGPDYLGDFQKQQIDAYKKAMEVGNVEPQ